MTDFTSLGRKANLFKLEKMQILCEQLYIVYFVHVTSISNYAIIR